MSAKAKPAKPKSAGKLKLSPGQLGLLWPMLAEAWAAHCAREQLADMSTNAKEEWRRQYLGDTLGVWSLKEIPKGGPLFAQVMAKFQEVARNGIDWILKAGQTTPADLLYHARAVLAEHDIPESYACGIARNACRLDHLPTLEELEPAQLSNVIKIVHAQGPRISTAAAKKTKAQPPEKDPF